MWETVYVPTTRVGSVTGRSGDTVRILKDRSGADIKVAPDDEAAPESDTRPIRIFGTEKAVASAYQPVYEIVDARPRPPVHAGPRPSLTVNGQLAVLKRLTIPNEEVSVIFGRSRAAFRDLQSKSGAKV